MANIAQTVNVLQAMLLTDPDTGALVRTPTFHVFAMNAGHHDARALTAHIVDGETRPAGGRELPMISASASTKDGAALVSLSNLDADAARKVVLDLRGAELASWDARVLTADSTAAHNTPEAPDAVSPVAHDGVRPHPRGLEVDLPAHSYVTVSLGLA
jgi:alpha-N-arabinofuranosidase